MGWDKTVPIALLRQAKFYQPQQAAAAATHVLWLVYCGNATFKCKAAAVHMPQYTSLECSHLCTEARVLGHPPPLSTLAPLNNLVYCGGTAVGFDAPQYKPFYMVPNYYLLLFELNIIFNYLNTILR